MKLRREGAPDRQVSSRAELERAIADLGGAGRGFAVLERGDGTWVQAAGSLASGFVFEVLDGGRHLQSRRGDLSREEVVALFGAWHDADERWRTALEWGPGPSDPASGAAGGWRPATYRDVLFVLAIALLLAAGGEWKRQRTRAALDRLEVTTGQVTTIEWVKGSGGRTHFLATVRFAAADRVLDVRRWVPKSTAVGARVAVWFEANDPAATASFGRDSSGYALAFALHALAGAVALFAAKMARDVSRLRGAPGGGAPRGSETDPPRARMIRG